MVCFHKYGGLGNQMFVYAFAREVTFQKRVSCCIGGLDKLSYFKLTSEDHRWNTLRFWWFKFGEKILRNATRHRLKDLWVDHYETVMSLTGNVVLDGYFQGERYFRHVKDEIRAVFEVKQEFREQFKREVPQFDKPTLVVHIRRTDYASSFQNLGIGSGSFVLPVSYYHDALQRVGDLTSYQLVFLSDDIEFVKRNFSEFPDAYYSSHSDIVDLQIMMETSALIIANSSFSWWGAWLNNRPEKKILSPAYFLGYKVKQMYPVNMIPDGWIQIPVQE